MALQSTATTQAAAVRHHAYHPIRIGRVVRETADARSFVLDVPEELRPVFAYEAGQFCTFRVHIDGRSFVRCYSMSSAPGIDPELQVTVKRVPDGVVSNWMNDTLAAGDVIEVEPPAGFFQLPGDERDIVAFGGGSGITPVFSLMKTALAKTTRRVRLLYANRDLDSVIFRREIDALAEEHADRVTVVHHLDVEHGFVGPNTIRPLLEPATDADFYICGPGPFMDIIEHTLHAHDIDPARVHIERFTPAERVEIAERPDAATTETRVTIELDGRTATVDHRPGTTILQTARQMGMSPPFSCEGGSCATCMARVTEGAVTMHVNNALTPEEVEEGWILTCQSVPTTPTVHVVYGWD